VTKYSIFDSYKYNPTQYAWNQQDLNSVNRDAPPAWP